MPKRQITLTFNKTAIGFDKVRFELLDRYVLSNHGMWGYLKIFIQSADCYANMEWFFFQNFISRLNNKSQDCIKILRF